jgi:hypothetical protein
MKKIPKIKNCAQTPGPDVTRDIARALASACAPADPRAHLRACGNFFFVSTPAAHAIAHVYARA